MNYVLEQFPPDTDDRPLPAIWDRQPDETCKSYNAFCEYLKLGPGCRSLDRVTVELYPHLGSKAAAGKRPSSTHIRVWSGKFRWAERVAAYDDDIRQRAVSSMRDEHVEIAKSMLQVGISKLQQALEDDRPWSLNEIRTWLIDSMKLERLAWGSDLMPRRSDHQADDAVGSMSLAERTGLYLRLTADVSAEVPDRL